MTSKTGSGFVRVQNGKFVLHNEPYCFLGANLWYGMNLGSRGRGGGRERLIRELDFLDSTGIRNLRILAGSEGPDSEPWRVTPSLQPEPGVYNTELLDGLDFLLFEMGKRGMKAVLYLTNFWEWSGGMAQYLSWHGAGAIPYPASTGNWTAFQGYTSKFFSHKKAMRSLNEHISFIVNRINSYTGTAYRDDPVIMAWQLCNEPRGRNHRRHFNRWINETADFIKSMDSNHLVSAGTEGEPPFRCTGLDCRKNNSGESIDYVTAHLWVQNWNIYQPLNHGKTFQASLDFAAGYINKHIRIAEKLKKPLVLEEFGFPRDDCRFDPGSTTVDRDRFFETIFSMVTGEYAEGHAVSGVNFWGWSGYGRPSEPYGSWWSASDDLLGDPPHEKQGWYGVYCGDTTVDIIKKYSDGFPA